MLSARTRQFRLFSAAAAMIVAMMLAPSAFARGGHNGGHHGSSHHGNWGISLGFAGPGYSIGYSDCRHCGRGYVSGNFYGGYGYGGYYPSAYAPAYYDSYYYPSYSVGYYDYPVYRHRPVTRRSVRYSSYYNDGPRHHEGHRGSRSHGHDYGDRDRDYSRAAYYDRHD